MPDSPEDKGTGDDSQRGFFDKRLVFVYILFYSDRIE